MITNWETDGIGAYETAMNSAGSATEEFERYTESAEYKLNQFNNALIGFWQQNLESDTLKGFIDLGIGFIDLLTNLTEKTGLLTPIAGTLTLAFLGLNKSARTTAITFGGSFVPSMKAAITTEKSLIAVTKTTTASLTGLKTAMVSVKNFAIGAFLPIATITAVTMGIQNLVQISRDAKEETENAKQKVKDLTDSYKENKVEIYELVDEYEKLEDITNKNTEQEQRYYEISNDLNELLPNLTENIDSKGQAHLKNVDAIKEELKWTEELAKQQLEIDVLESEKELLSFDSKLAEYENKIKALQIKLDNPRIVRGGRVFEYTNEELVGFELTIKEYEHQISQLYSSLSSIVADSTKKILAYNNIATDDEMISVLDEYTAKLDLNNKTQEERVQISYDLAKAIELIQSGEDFSSQNANWYKDVFGELSLTQLQELVKLYQDTTKATEDLTNAEQNRAKSLTELQSVVKTASEETELLNKAQKELDDQGYLSQETMDELIIKYDDFIEITGLSEDAIYDFITATKENKVETINAEIEKTDILIEQTEKRIQAMDVEKEKLRELINANPDNEFLSKQYLNSGKDIRDSLNELEDLKNKKTYLEKSLNNLNRDPSSKSNSSSSKSTSDSITNLESRYTMLNKAIADTNAQIDLNNTLMESASDSDKITLLQKQNDLYEEQKDNLHALNEERRNELAELYGVSRKEYDKMSQDQLRDSYAKLNDELTKLYAKGNSQSESDKTRIKVLEDTINRIDSLTDAVNKDSIQWHNLTDEQKENLKTQKDIQKELKATADELVNSYMSYLSDGINDEIDRLQKEKEGWQQFYQTKIDGIQQEIDNLNERNELLREEEERLEKLNDLAEQRTKISNIEKEKNVQIYQDGKFVWIADPRALEEETKRLQELEDDYNSWEIENQRRHEIELLEDEIEALELKLKKKEEIYDKDIDKLEELLRQQEDLTKQSVDNQITSWDQLITELGELGIAYRTELGNIITWIDAYNQAVNGMSIPSNLSGISTGSTGIIATNNSDVDALLNQMSQKSQDWYDVTSKEEQDKLHQENQKLADEIAKQTGRKPIYDPGTGEWDVLQYKKGGVTTKTGLHWLDGTPSNPEYIFNSDQLKRMFNLKAPTFNMDNFIPKSKPAITTPTGDTFYLSDFTVQTNDVNDFLNQMRRRARN